ncbi:MAG: hypothetical protein ACOC0D_00950 [Spirochaeta sp.]
MNPSITLSTVVRAQTSNGRIRLPLDQPGLFIRFKHIQGIPARSDGEGFPLYKLRMLDTLIDRLHSMRSGDGFTPPGKLPQSEEAVDMMLENYERQVRAAAAHLDMVGYGKVSGLSGTGSVVQSLA